MAINNMMEIIDMAREPEPMGYYTNPDPPFYPIHAKVAYAESIGLVPITPEKARELSDAISAPDKAAQQARAVTRAAAISKLVSAANLSQDEVAALFGVRD